MRDIIYVLDFGSQYSHLIVRRIRELGVFSELVPPQTSTKKLAQARGLVISGGPRNLSGRGALNVDRGIYQLGLPVLGICYGLQLMARDFGGQVVAGRKREYGPMLIRIKSHSPLLTGLNKTENTWMSHGDQVGRLPAGFVKLAASENCPVAAMADERRRLYGLQFHPEVTQTVNGRKILENFVKITGAKKAWSMRDFVKNQVKKIKETVGQQQVVSALSGGVDSSVAASLTHRAIGKNLHCILVDTGLMRLGEVRQIIRTFHSYQKINLKVVNAERRFLSSLRGVTDPEKKRKIIGELFIRIFEREARKIKGASWLLQGTLYTDAITSGVSVGGKAAVIKSHHNVGGLPEKFGFKLLEPFRELYKDEVRKVGRILGLPPSVVERQPFPGPGLAVRIIGAVSKPKLEILRQADLIVREEIEKSNWHKKTQQYFAVLPDIRSVGVQGDARTYGFPIIVRAVTTRDFMTADWTKFTLDILARISSRITNEVKGVNRTLYDITSKPPGTVEWE